MVTPHSLLHNEYVSRRTLLPAQPLVEVVQKETDALVIVRVQFQRL